MIHVFISAFKDGNYVVPVKLLVKEFYKNDNGLYVTMTLRKAKETVFHDQSQNESRSLTISEIKLSELLSIVKVIQHSFFAVSFYKKAL